jgi:hypothetical protein
VPAIITPSPHFGVVQERLFLFDFARQKPSGGRPSFQQDNDIPPPASRCTRRRDSRREGFPHRGPARPLSTDEAPDMDPFCLLIETIAAEICSRYIINKWLDLAGGAGTRPQANRGVPSSPAPCRKTRESGNGI